MLDKLLDRYLQDILRIGEPSLQGAPLQSGRKLITVHVTKEKGEKRDDEETYSDSAGDLFRRHYRRFRDKGRARRRHTRATPSPSATANIRVSHVDALHHVEPSVAVNPSDPNNLLAASQLLSTDNPDQPTLLGTSVSFDGGQTWQENEPLAFPANYNSGYDVTVAFDSAGTAYVAASGVLASDQGTGRQDRSVLVWRSVDGGRTFPQPVAAIKGQNVDHPWLAVDPEAAGTIYVAWTEDEHQHLGFTKSMDGGQSFSTPTDVPGDDGQYAFGSVLAAGPDGAVFIAYLNVLSGPEINQSEEGQPGADALLQVVHSSDGGQHFDLPVTIEHVKRSLEPTPGVTLAIGPSIAVDPVSGAANIAYAVAPEDSSPIELHVVRSDETGVKWGDPYVAAPLSLAPRPFSHRLASMARAALR
jgi:hypothetical protein